LKDKNRLNVPEAGSFSPEHSALHPTKLTLTVDCPARPSFTTQGFLPHTSMPQKVALKYGARPAGAYFYPLKTDFEHATRVMMSLSRDKN
jgi:hypothetical protein